MRDSDLSQVLSVTPELIKEIERSSDPAEDSVQPCSVDLRIGAIFTPRADSDEAARDEDARIEYKLGTGQTAVVETRESLSLPKDIGAIGFPPAAVSSAGLLTTNPGHVDPGYQGRMSFTVINMGRDPYVLRQGNPIATLLLFRLPQEVDKGYADRRSSSGTPQSEEDRRKNLLGHLSPDFVDVKRRADAAAEAAATSAEERLKQHIDSEERQTRRWSFWAPVGATLLAIILTIVGGILANNLATDNRIDDLDKKTSLIERDLGEVKGGKTVDRRLQDLETQVNKLKK